MAKETNLKQKLSKTPSCKQEITKINMDNIRNFLFLSFSKVAFIVVHSQ